MAIALDTTAHPTNASNLTAFNNGGGAAWQTITPAAFSTGAGPVIIRAFVMADGTANPFASGAAVAWVGGTPSGWSAFTLRVDKTSAGHDFGVQIWTAHSASTALSSKSVAFTASTSSASQKGYIGLLVENGVAATEAACIGASAGFIDEVGVNNTIAQSITPNATGSSLAGIYVNGNVNTALTANAQTLVFDAHHEPLVSDALAFGRYKVSGTFTLSTIGVAKSLGATDVDQFAMVAVLEIMAPSAAAPVGFYNETSLPPAKRLPAPPSESFRPASATPVITPAWGYDARSYELRPRPKNCSPHESVFAPVAPVAAVTPPSWGYAAEQAARLPRRAPAQSGESRAPAFAYANLPYVFPLSISANGRYLVDANGLPFPIFGDSAWEAVHNLTAGELEQLLDDRVSRGFTATLLPVIEHKFTSQKPPKDLAGNLPFTLRLDGGSWTGSPNGTTTTSGNGVNGNTGGNTFTADPYVTVGNESPDFTFPNSTYWAKVDAWISLCALKGVACFVFCNYVGFAANDEGWSAEMVANDAITGAGGQTGQPFADPTKSKLWNYAAWLANRYKAFGNIIWIDGGDTGGSAQPLSANVSNAVLHFIQGMQSVAGQASVLRVGHWRRTMMGSDISTDPTNGAALAAALSLESVYPDVSAAQYARAGYAHSPAQPVFDIEDDYEQESGGEPNRRFQIWQLISGVAGYFWCAGLVTIGSVAYWGFPVGWQNQLTTPGALDMQRLNTFWQSISWWRLVPSGLGGMKSLVTSGGGTASPQSTDYVSAAAIPDGTLLVAYRPPAHSGTITIDMTAMAGPTRSRWFDPTNGLYTADAAGLAATGTHVFTVPGNNSAGATDWLLVLDAAPSLAWTPTQPDQLQPRRVIGPERPIAIHAPVQPAAPVIQVQTPQPDRLPSAKPAPRPDQMLPVGPAAQVVPPGMGWAPEVPDIQAAKVPSPDRSTSVLPPVQPAAALPVLSTVTAPDQFARPPRAKAEIATAPTQAFPLPIQPAVTLPDGPGQARRPVTSDPASAPTQPAVLLPVQPQVSQPDTATVPRRPAVSDVASAPPQPQVAVPVQPQAQLEQPGAPARRAAAETAMAPQQPSALVAPPTASMETAAAPRPRARGDVAQAPTQPTPALPIQPQSAVHDAPLKPRPSARAEVSGAPFQPPPPPTFFSAVNSLPGKAARALFDTIIRPIINFVRPTPVFPKPSLFISGVRDSLSISGQRDQVSISGVFGMPASDAISMPCGAKRVIRWVYREEATDQQKLAGQLGDSIDLTDVAEIIFTATVTKSPTSTAITQKKLSRGEILISDAVNGVALIVLLPADTANFPAGQYFYDVKVIFADDVTDDDFPSIAPFTLTEHSSR